VREQRSYLTPSYDRSLTSAQLLRQHSKALFPLIMTALSSAPRLVDEVADGILDMDRKEFVVEALPVVLPHLIVDQNVDLLQQV